MITREQITPVSQEIVKAIVENRDIVVTDEFGEEIEAVFDNYYELWKAAVDSTKDSMTRRNIPWSEFERNLQRTAEQKGIKVGGETIDFLLDQLTEKIMHSEYIEKGISEEPALRQKMQPVMKKYFGVDDALDAEIRAKLKNVPEGSRTWEIEYKRIQSEILKRRAVR